MARRATFVGLDPFKLSRVHVTDRELGHGAYAVVMEVEYMGLKCAGKKIHELLLKQGEMSYSIHRFEDECKILSQVRHPNIVQFLGVYYQQGMKVPMLVMEFLPTNLSSEIKLKGILPKELNYSILHDVALGLQYLHMKHPPIIHRDLSANNVLLTVNMKAKISDLGMARMINMNPLQVSKMTETPGTPAYMPPEVMIANPTYDTSVDQFSYGVLMIHALSGKWPEPQCSQIRMEAGKMIPVSEAGRREEYLSDIGHKHPLMELILKCINNDPSSRAKATEIVETLADMVLRFPDPFITRLNSLSAQETVTQMKYKRRTDSYNLRTIPDECNLTPVSAQQHRLSVAQEKWFLNIIDVGKAERKCKKDGDFLVRIDRHNQFHITCRWNGEVKHIAIDDAMLSRYATLRDFISYHIEYDIPLHDHPIRLIFPVNKHNDEWALDHSQVTMTTKLYSGVYGNILEATVKKTGERVIAKSYHRSTRSMEAANQFHLEITLLKQYNHQNIVRMIGFCADCDPMYIIMEHAPGGLLLDSLKSRQANHSKKQLCSMCIDVCRAMEYIHSKQRVLCNLTARSCLVGRMNTIKLFKFGLSCQMQSGMEYIRVETTTVMPLKWMAPEVFNFRKYMFKSDIWSYGVLMWEIFTGGKLPYQGMTNETARSKVEIGYHMDPPADCPKEISRIMLSCWKYEPERRQDFATLAIKLQDAYKNL